MNKKTIFIATSIIAVIVFIIGGIAYKQNEKNTAVAAAKESTSLVRPHSPIIGPENAPVTLVEFFDPSCEACRAFYPAVKSILAKHPDDVRLVLRYAAFHQGSDEAVKILEAAKIQNLFKPVLEKLFEEQPKWASHDAPDLNSAWEAAGSVGLDIVKAKVDAARPEIAEVLKQDMADVQTNNVRSTPTFFVNGNLLTSFGEKQLLELVENEIANVKKK
jgi:protein-disulfide isomerase